MHFLGASLQRPRTINTACHVVVVSHYRIGGHVDGEDRHHFIDADGKLAMAMLEVVVDLLVVHSQEISSHAARKRIVSKK